jgi:membrane protease YdiL (CAAX protease family)
MPLNAFFIEWNNQMDLPGWLDGMEKWMKDKENALKELTQYLTSFDTIPQLIAGLVVIALIPAIGEELLFRGLLQPRVFQITKNMHAAIWITGFIFSAIHMQFYGLIPRMLLGVLFGYVYVWSGNLWYPIIGHFVNNGFTLVMIYLYNSKMVDIDIEGTSAIPMGTSILSLAFCATLILALKQYYFKNRTSPGM